MFTILFLSVLFTAVASYNVGRITTVKRVSREEKELARWVDHAITDDMVRPLLPEAQIEKGKDLVRRYYDRP